MGGVVFQERDLSGLLTPVLHRRAGAADGAMGAGGRRGPGSRKLKLNKLNLMMCDVETLAVNYQYQYQGIF
jgi:hypothetical protein